MIYLVRHGLTDANRTRYAGREEVPLNNDGIKQAQALANSFPIDNVSLILSSPLSRAIQTAIPLSIQQGASIRVRSTLTELDFGVRQGTPKEQSTFVLRKQHLYAPMECGESLYDVWNRIGDLCSELTALSRSQHAVVVVGHYWTNRLLYGRLQGLAFEEAVKSRLYRPANGSYVKFSIGCQADIKHVRELRQNQP